jgi:hypothetical protein
MQILFTKVIHFTRLIKAGGRLREFNLRKLKQHDKDVFSVDTVDDRGNRIIFRMTTEGHNGSWTIAPTDFQLPSWIPEVEGKLREGIEEALHQG